MEAYVPPKSLYTSNRLRHIPQNSTSKLILQIKAQKFTDKESDPTAK
jgi:hypothetical protein